MHYLDASFLIPLVKPDVLSDRVEAVVRGLAHEGLVTSHWTVVECRSGLAREVRMGMVSASDFKSYRQQLDETIAAGFHIALPTEDDFRVAAALIEKPELGLRSGDAIHLAIAQRLEVGLLTLDRKIIAIARDNGIRAGSGLDQELI